MKRYEHAASRGGMALVITLVFVALITILVVAMSTAVLIDRPAAKSHFEKVRAMQFAQTGVDQVIAVLRQNIGQTNRYWISGPGQLVVASTTNNILNSTNQLYSGTATATLTGVFQPQSLNLATFQDPSTYLITGQPDATGTISPMQIAWIYIRRDGTSDSSATPVTNNAANPIVGRYAYWTDDESSKVNLNLAWGRSAANAGASYGSPTKVDLTALTNMTSAAADAIHTNITTNGYGTLQSDFFNSPKDARRVGSAVAPVLATNQFFTTFYNHDPDMTVFDTPRIVLTTQKRLANGRPFLDILATDNIDPGDPNNVDVNKLNTVLFGSGGTTKAPVYPGLFWYMVRKDWPMAPNSSFVQKYAVTSSTATNSICEMALNIIDYVRSKESTNSVIAPIRGSLSGAGAFGIGTGPIMACTRGPRITEMGMWISSTGSYTGNPSKYATTAQARIEVYLPPAYGLASVDLTKLWELVQYYDTDGNFEQAVNQAIAAADCSPSSILTNGGYVTISHTMNPFELSFNTNSAPGRPLFMQMRAGISIGPSGTTNLVDIVPLGYTPIGTMVQVPIDATSVATNNITSMEVDDPNANLYTGDWKVHQGGLGNSFGLTNSCSTLHKTQANVWPQQDTEAFGQISDASFYMPPPKGQMFTNPVTSVVDDNTAGVVSSVGELGFLPTGMIGATNDIPWRTLRLQPNGQATSVVPDWALLDLFTVPVASASTNASYVFLPHSTSVGGRININASASSAPFSLNRTTPLVAALSGCIVYQTNNTTLSTTQAQTVAQNIYSDTLSPGTTAGKQYGSVPFYYTPGQIAEISGVADSGESSEALLRQAINLLTNRGEVFSVYTVGQSLQQTASGTLIVTGEERLQAVVERYLDATVTPAAIRFRIVEFQRLTP